MVNALMVCGLAYRYLGRGTPVLNDLRFDLPENRLTFTFGPNGSGKSTLFRILLRLLHTDSGGVEIGGCRLESYGPVALTGVINYTPQSSKMLFSFSGQHTMVLGRVTRRGLWISPREADWEAVDKALEAVGMTGLGEREIQELSGGKRQLVLITRALYQGRRLPVLDEPTSALDAGSQIRVSRRFRRLMDRQSLTVLLSSHQPNHAFEFVGDILFLKQGRSPGLKSITDLTGEDLSHPYDLLMRVADLTDMPGLHLCVTRSETRGDQ